LTDLRGKRKLWRCNEIDVDEPNLSSAAIEALHGIVWHCVALCGIVWHFVTSLDIVRHRMILFDLLKLCFQILLLFLSSGIRELALQGEIPTSHQGCQMVYFQTKNSTFGKKLEGLGIENVVIFYYHFYGHIYIWYNLQPFDIVCGHLVYLFYFVMLGPRKIWQPCLPPC
jgi:hypothetical protein